MITLDLVLLLTVLLLKELLQCNAGFVEVPFNQTLTYPAAMVAVFRCQHESPEARITWLINGRVLRFSSQSDIQSSYITHDNGSETGILTIPSDPLYNGTQVECEASLVASREITRVATLIITTGVLAIIETMNSAFNEIPSPMLMVVTPGEQHIYKCSHSTADRITWRVNDRILGVEILTIPGIEHTDTISHPDDSIFTLQVRALSRNNETTIQCTAAFVDRPPQPSPIATFLIQGELQSVSNLKRNGSTLAWEAPFSLDLTGIDPDIVYCVEVVNITCGRRDVIVSDCNVTEPSYTSDDIASYGYIYEYTVTPRSNVEGARNGTSGTVSEEFVLLKSFRQPQLSMINESKVMVSIHVDIYNIQALTGNQVYAESHTMSLTALDGQNDGGEVKHLPNIVIRNAMFQVPLPFRRLWNYTILAHGCDEHPLMNATLLSTHDMQEIIIASPSAGTIMIMGNFIPDSPAVGVHVAVSNTSEISFHFLRREGNVLHNKGVLSNVRGGQHMVSVFVVDQTGLPFSRTATIPQSVVVNGNNNQSFPVQFELKSASTGVCITCTFLDKSTTGCVAVVHQRISQLSSSGLMNIESSHKFNRSGDTAYGCIEGVNLEQFQVGVVEGTTKELPTLHTTMSKSTACTTSCVVGVGVVSILIFILIISLMSFATYYVCVIRRKQKIRVDSNNVNIELQKCGAYEVVKLSRQRVTMNDNPAYGEIGVGVH